MAISAQHELNVFLHLADSLHFARTAQDVADGGLQSRNMVTLNPKLVDVVRHAKGERILGRFDQRNSRKPPLKSVRADVWVQGKRQLLPELTEGLFHVTC